MKFKKLNMAAVTVVCAGIVTAGLFCMQVADMAFDVTTGMAYDSEQTVVTMNVASDLVRSERQVLSLNNDLSGLRSEHALDLKEWEAERAALGEENDDLKKQIEELQARGALTTPTDPWGGGVDNPPGTGDGSNVLDSYLIQPGDTLTWISNQTKISVDELADFNHIPDVNLINAGNKLLIPKLEPATPYLIQNGDTLWGISNMFSFDLNRLSLFNHLRNPNLIYADSYLRLPLD